MQAIQLSQFSRLENHGEPLTKEKQCFFWNSKYKHHYQQKNAGASILRHRMHKKSHAIFQVLLWHDFSWKKNGGTFRALLTHFVPPGEVELALDDPQCWDLPHNAGICLPRFLCTKHASSLCVKENLQNTSIAVAAPSMTIAEGRRCKDLWSRDSWGL